jgi:hypothetical protein
MSRGAKKEPDVVQITDAPQSVGDEIDGRQRKYLWSMALRTACFVGAIAVHGPVRWVLVAAALILPYLAVVMANSTGPKLPGSPENPDPFRPQLPSGR